MKNKIILFVTIFYVIITISTSILLIRRNEYGIIESSRYYYLIDGETIGTNRNDLVKIKKVKSFDRDDHVYFMNYYGKVEQGKITSVFSTGEATIGEFIVPKEDVYGDTLRTYTLVGLVIKILTNKYVYLFGIILPMFLLFIYEIYLLVIYLKKDKKKKVGFIKNGKAKKIIKNIKK